MFTSQRHQRISELFLAACEREAEGRDDWLRQQCAGDPNLLDEVKSLLSYDAQAHDLVKTSPPDGAIAVESGFKEPTPLQIGHYKILRPIGTGGMGVVYEAQQDHPRRTVALKVMLHDATSDALVSRFRREAELLGQLQHPFIAHMYEAGVAPATYAPSVKARKPMEVVPFIAMEYVDGFSITEFAGRHSLGLREKLELLARVCDAVQHAHNKGVMHRDLKPSNILVVDDCAPDGKCNPSPRILDFGLARLTNSNLQTSKRDTQVGYPIGTLQYMSPEQAAGDPANVDTRTDVYALGAIGYELLTGHPPHNLDGKNPLQSLRIISEEHATPLGEINKSFRGVLSTIIATAMHKDRDRRYQAASELGGDIRRYLRNEPPTVNPPSSWYRVSLFTRRHKGIVAGACLALVGLVFGTSLAIWQAAEAARQRNLAIQARTATETQLSNAERLKTLLVGILGSVNPETGLQQPQTADQLLDIGREWIEANLKMQPDDQADLRMAVGEILLARGRYDEAEQQYRLALETRRRLHGSAHPSVAEALNDLAAAMFAAGRNTDAVQLSREALQIARQAYGEDDVRVATAMDNQSEFLQAIGEFNRAEPLCRGALAMRKRLLGDNHPDVATSLNNLASLLFRKGDRGAAEPIYVQAIEIYKRRGDKNPEVASCLSNLGRIWSDRGEYSRAESYYRDALTIQKKILPTGHRDTIKSQSMLGQAVLQLKRFSEAEGMLREALELQEASKPRDDWALYNTMSLLGSALSGQRKFAEAEPLLLQSYSALKDNPTTKANHRATLCQRLVTLYDDWGRPDKASEWRGRIPTTQTAATNKS